MPKKRKLREIFYGETVTRHDGQKFNVLIEVDDEKLAEYILGANRLQRTYDRAKEHATAESKRLGRGVVVHVAALGKESQ